MPAPSSPPDAIPAATLVVMRDRGDADPEILMVERAGIMTFAPGAMVFPGGRVDPADHALAATMGLDDDGAARIAVIRETIEEAGLAIGVTGALDAASTAGARAALHAGASLAEALTAVGAALDLASLIPFARWRPDGGPVRRFDTRFYLAALPADALPAQVDGTENVRLRWADARSVLADADAGRLTLIFPTRCNLERLARFRSSDAALDHARTTPVRTVVPWIETRDGEDYLCIPDDLGYPVTAARLDAARRG